MNHTNGVAILAYCTLAVSVRVYGADYIAQLEARAREPLLKHFNPPSHLFLQPSHPLIDRKASFY